WVDDFDSGTRAAAAGGITTVGNMTTPEPGEGPLALIERVGRDAARSARVDFVLHPVLIDPSAAVLDELPVLAERGHTSLKIFMTLGNFDGRAGQYLRAIEIAGRHGMLSLIHCEDGCVVNHLIERLVREGRAGPGSWPA